MIAIGTRRGEFQQCTAFWRRPTLNSRLTRGRNSRRKVGGCGCVHSCRRQRENCLASSAARWSASCQQGKSEGNRSAAACAICCKDVLPSMACSNQRSASPSSEREGTKSAEQ